MMRTDIQIQQFKEKIEMKKTTKLLSLIMAISIVLIALTACSVSKDDLIGTWKGEWTYNGAKYSGTIVFKYTGYFTLITYKNGVINSYVTGDYEIDGKTIRLYDDSSLVHHGEAQVFEYKSGKLTSGVSTYTKAD